MSPAVRPLVAVVCSLAIHAPALAGCTKDTDCKGDRICVDEVCVDPPPSSSPSTPPASGLTDTQLYALDGVMAKAVSGMAVSGGMAGLGIATILTNDGYNETAPRVLGGATLITAGIATPLAAGGSIQARRIARSEGVTLTSTPLLPVTSWIGYASTMGVGTYMLIAGVSGETIPNYLIAMTVSCGVVSTLGMAVDASVASSEIRAALGDTAATSRRAPPLQLGFAPTRDGGRLHLGGVF